MALTLDKATGKISVPQADLTLVSGTIYTMDAESYFWRELMALLATEDYMPCIDAYNRNTAVTVAGTTFAPTFEIINGYTVEFTPDAQWTVVIEQSNNNIFDVAGGILVQNQVQVIPTNSAGLIVYNGTGGGGTILGINGIGA